MDHLLPLQSSTLHKLNLLRYKHDSQPSEQAYLQFQRKQADAPDPALQKAWFNSMRAVLEEIDQVLHCVPERLPFRFLDLGCCPGGFSSYILGKNRNAYGVGISLPTESGGHSCLLKEDELERFQLYWADLTRYQLGPAFIDDPKLQNFPVSPGFDLVLIDGHPLRSAQGVPNIFLHGDQLLISQIIVGLVSVALGGTVILKQSKPERLITSQLIFLLDGLCAEVRTWKPVCMHGTRSTFYIVAKGIGLGCLALRSQQLLNALMELWVELSYTGANGTGRKLTATDLDFIVDSATLKGAYAPRLHELSNHIWTTQAKCLKGWRKAQANGF
ncbi:hypothetical protein B0H15DRAFT_611058 [Mycena belliarum]|uniref:Ribosomal RNA methyltransferase FtsJ domain-containing protein n=1 Tax=Mycena belliarum TaxID=1033014 RepID=A0AAD6TV70_9AGAR|nr:hypothetical protein B0H15DRAFT_611058 [Mycena belliae]